jgi:glycosyltransferase involved in cell wall biosynthesis
MYVAAHNGARIWGGAERATALLLAGLQDRGHRVRLYCNAEVVEEGARALGVPVERFPLGGDIAVPHALRFARVLRRERPDVLLVGTFKKLWLAALAARRAGVPRLVARVGLETDTPRSWKYRLVLARWVDTVVVNAGSMRGAFLALPGWTPERVVTIHNGVRPPLRLREPGAVREELGIGPVARVVGAVARLAAQKRLDRLLRAVATLPDDVHCVLAGEGDLRESLEALAGELRIAGRVHFLGQREDVGDVLDALDLYVVTSEREGMSNSMLEALAAGLPVVSTRVSGAEEALRPFADGSAPGVVIGFDEDELATTLAELLGDAVRLAAMRAVALRRAEEFDFDRMLDAWERVLAPSTATRREAAPR